MVGVASTEGKKGLETLHSLGMVDYQIVGRLTIKATLAVYSRFILGFDNVVWLTFGATFNTEKDCLGMFQYTFRYITKPFANIHLHLLADILVI